MKHPAGQDPRPILLAPFAADTPPLDEVLAERLAEYASWAAPMAAKLNLTRYGSPAEFAAKLILPSLTLLSASLSPYMGESMLDFGAGCGAVGLTIAVLRPDVQVVLADRRARVVQFVDICRARLGLSNCRAVLTDLAQGPPDAAAAHDIVAVRAFSPVAGVLELSSRWKTPDGCVAMWHQPPPPLPSPGLRRIVTVETTVTDLQLTIYTA